MSWSVDFHVDEERKVTVEVDWQGPADYRLRRLDGETSTKHRRAGRYFDTARLRLQLGPLVRSTGCYL